MKIIYFTALSNVVIQLWKELLKEAQAQWLTAPTELFYSLKGQFVFYGVALYEVLIHITRRRWWSARLQFGESRHEYQCRKQSDELLWMETRKWIHHLKHWSHTVTQANWPAAPIICEVKSLFFLKESGGLQEINIMASAACQKGRSDCTVERWKYSKCSVE